MHSRILSHKFNAKTARSLQFYLVLPGRSLFLYFKYVVMRRVSSRQRLVSWDAFDATAGSDSDEANESSYACHAGDIDEESYTHESYSMNLSAALDEDVSKTQQADGKGSKFRPRIRKRDRRSKSRNSVCKNIETPIRVPAINFESQDVQAIIPSYPWEISKPSQSKTMNFDDLIDDLHLGICSFLDLSSIRSVMAINRRYRELMLSADAKVEIWSYHCETVWNLEPDGSQMNLVDDLSLPVAATTFGCKSITGGKGYTNLSLLLSLAPTHFATSIDEASLRPRSRLRRDIQRTIPVYRVHEEDQLIRSYRDSTTGRHIFQYTGHVGQGDRCIRGNHPIPKRTRSIITSASYAVGGIVLGDGMLNRPSLFDLLRSRSKKPMLPNSSGTMLSPTFSFSEFAPFVVPFAEHGIDGKGTKLNITPRFVSYFEVSILKFKDNGGTNAPDDGVPIARRYRTNYQDCVAVGVATSAFHYQSRMPGWDRESYGYHGDDGGIFHSAGEMLKRFGPKFGPGDTVGCGIDYISKGIFYTLNGEFLGYAWENISDERLQRDLFPVVGIDTNSPIHVNFGSIPFQFDLSRFIKKHDNIISTVYSLDGLSGMGSTDVKATKCSSINKKKPAAGFSSSVREKYN